MRQIRIAFGIAAAAIGLSTIAAAQSPVSPSFTYQGRLAESGQPVNGAVNLSYSLWDAAGSGSPPTGGNQVGGVVNKPGTQVVDGLFTVTINEAGEFGPNEFTGENRWLQISVNGTTLSPRQPLTATPYARYAVQAGPSPLIIPFDGEASLAIPGLLDLENTRTTGGTLCGIFRVRSTGDNTRAITGLATGGTGLTYGVFGDSNSTSGIGVYGESSGYAGVYGRVKATTGANYGVLGQADSTSGIGVYGLADSLSGATCGLYGEVRSPNGFGAYVVGGRNAFFGDVGIGTSTPAANLHIAGTSSPQLRLEDWSAGGKTYHISVESSDHSLRFAETAVATRMVISSAGNVGIGTTTPGFRLDVSGRARIRQGGSASAGVYFYQDAPADDRGFIGMRNDAQLGLYGTQGGGWGLLMDVANGNVGVGTGAPTQRLDVNGSIHTQGGILFGNGVHPGGSQFLSFAVSGVSEDFMKYAANTFVFDDSPGGGDAYLPSLLAEDFFTYSDERLKKDIEPLTDALDTVRRLQAIRYRFDGTKIDPAAEGAPVDTRVHVGFAAQAVAVVAPEAVRYWPELDRYGVSYGSLVPVLVEAIKEQQAQIDALRAEMAAMKTRLSSEEK